MTSHTPRVIALVGNPNTGKSTLFNALAGMHQRVGNYPGVTVEKRIGRLKIGEERFLLIDLPGTRSLAPRSRDEMVAVNVLLGRQPDTPKPELVICIADAVNLWRHLYLLSQVLELGLPVVFVVNMIDVAEREGVSIDFERLAKRLQIPLVLTQAHKGIGVEELKKTVLQLLQQPWNVQHRPLPNAVYETATKLGADLSRIASALDQLPQYLLVRLLLDVGGYLEQTFTKRFGNRVAELIQHYRDELAKTGFNVPDDEIQCRDRWANEILAGLVTTSHRTAWTDRLDAVLTHPVVGTVLFVFLMLFVFQSVFRWAEPINGLFELALDWLAQLAERSISEGPLQRLVVEGIIGGVGSVITFLPQIVILFLWIGVLEDCGYMARAAYLMDGLLHPVGLSGKSFIPLMCSYACGVPGIMATRVIESEHDRLVTILVAPLMTCSARLPVYVLFISAFVPNRPLLGGLLNLQGVVLASMYLLGTTAAIVVAIVFKRTLLRAPTAPFVMELPTYKWPSAKVILFRAAERGWIFLRTAGTIILAVSVLIWAALYYPHDEQAVRNDPVVQRLEKQLVGLPFDTPQHAELSAALERAMQAAYQRHSYLGRLGRFIEPVVKPLGWDWRIGCAVLASFPAREVVVATLGVMFNLPESATTDASEGPSQIRRALQNARWENSDRPLFTLPVALSIMVFFTLCAQCAATLAVIGRETNSLRWPVFTFAYMTGLAYFGAFVTYQLASLLL